MSDFLKKVVPARVKEIIKDVSGINFIKNYFKTNFKRTVLISYINKPFISGQSFKHTNYHEALAIAEVFRSLEYNVDLINYTSSRRYDLSDYSVVFGLGEAVEYALQNRNGLTQKPFVIWHGTGSSPFFSNPLTVQRLKYTHDKSGSLFVESTRFLEKIYPLSYIFSDLIILYGNEFTRSTYHNQTYSPIELITPTAYFSGEPQVKTKNNSNYLWFGSAGAIHKGLDLLLDYFSENPHLTLHICSDLTREAGFYEFYKQKLVETSNIRYYGFMDISSDSFRELMKTATFTILPSCSEGIATSVITTMANGGMIPVVTKNSGIDLHDYGIEINELTTAGVDKAIQIAQDLSSEEILRRSKKIIAYSRDNYTIENFAKNLQRILLKHLNV